MGLTPISKLIINYQQARKWFPYTAHMTQRLSRPSWRFWVVLLSLSSLLFSLAVWGSHVHSSITQGGVQQECSLCITGGVSSILTHCPPIVSLFILFLFLFPLFRIQPHCAQRQKVGDPRSPPPLPA